MYTFLVLRHRSNVGILSPFQLAELELTRFCFIFALLSVGNTPRLKLSIIRGEFLILNKFSIPSRAI